MSAAAAGAGIMGATTLFSTVAGTVTTVSGQVAGVEQGKNNLELKKIEWSAELAQKMTIYNPQR